MTRITNHMVRDWRSKLAAGATITAVAAEYGTTRQTISRHCPEEAKAKEVARKAPALARLGTRVRRNERLVRSCIRALAEARV